MSETYCPIPWIFQAVRNNGDIRVCCQANVTKNQGVVRKPDGTPYNAGRDSMDEARNAPLMNHVRKQMLNGVWSTECERCRTEEDSGLNSRRMYELDNWNFTYNDAINSTNSDGTLKEVALEYLDIRFGNLCNLACRMCGPTDSHTWYEQWTKYHGANTYKDTHGIVNLVRNEKGRLETTDYGWHSSESFWEQLNKYIPTLKHVYMAGGEPLMIERHYQFLQQCIDTGHSTHIVLEYNTNMTTLPNKVLDMWTKFKQVRVGASIDGYGKVLEYQRWPIKWDQAYKNLQKLDEYSQKNTNIIAWLACTVTAYNVWHIPEFMYWKLKESGFKKINSSTKRPIITHHVAHQPKRMNIRILPDYLKKQLADHYSTWKDVFLSDSELSDAIKTNGINILDSITNYQFSNHDTTQELAEFIKFTKFLDSERKQTIIEIVPQYNTLF